MVGFSNWQDLTLLCKDTHLSDRTIQQGSDLMKGSDYYNSQTNS